jgi:hypothetical protein
VPAGRRRPGEERALVSEPTRVTRAKRAGVIERMHGEVDAARDQFYNSTLETSDQVDALEAWQALADQLFNFETREGMRPVYRGPSPRWSRPAR